MVQGICIIVFMIAIMALMVARKMPTTIALFVLAIGISLIGGVSFADLSTNVIAGGAVKLASNIMIAIFASWLGSIMEVTGITRTMIKKGAELGGDKTVVVTIILYVIGSLIHAVLTGLGGAIMVGSIMIPILIAVGVDKSTAACVYLWAYGTGNTFSLDTTSNYASITSTEFQLVYNYSLILAAICAVSAIVFIIVRIKIVGKKFAFSAPTGGQEEEIETSDYQIKGVLGALSMISPIMPIVLVAVFHWEVIPAIMVSILWAVLLTCTHSNWKKTMNMMSKTLYEGFRRQAPASTMMIAIGMLLQAVNQESVSTALRPFMEAVVPGSELGCILFFAILAPLVFYRGPLNLWGLGAGLAALIISLGLLPNQVVMAGFVAVAVLQVVSCPTNTHNTWASGFVSEDATQITFKQLPFIWPAVALMVIIGVLRFWV